MLIVKFIAFSKVGSLALQTPLQSGTLLVILMCTILIRSFSSKTQSTSRITRWCWEWLLDWKAMVTRTKVPTITILPGAGCPAWQAKRCVLPRIRLKTLACPVILVHSSISASDPGRPLAPSPHGAKARDTSCLCQQSGCLRAQAPAARGSVCCLQPVVCVPHLSSD